MAALTPPDQQLTLANNLSQLTITDEEQKNDPAIFSFGAQPIAAAAPTSAAPPSPFFFGAAAPSSSVPTSATSPSEAQPEGSTQRRYTNVPRRSKSRSGSTWGVDTDYAAVQTKLNAVQEKMKEAVVSKDYAAAGALQSEQSRLQEQFKTVYEAHQQMLQEKLQERYSNGGASIMSAQEMEKIRLQVWIDYIQRTFTPDLELAVFQLLDCVSSLMKRAAKKGLHTISLGILDRFKSAAKKEALKTVLNTVMTSRVALTNFSWQLFEAGYEPSVSSAGDIDVGMLRSFEKQAANNKPQETFVNYFERGVNEKCGQGQGMTFTPPSGFGNDKPQNVGLPVTDVVSIGAARLWYDVNGVARMWQADSSSSPGLGTTTHTAHFGRPRCCKNCSKDISDRPANHTVCYACYTRERR